MRITFFTILGLLGLAAGVLFFPPLRAKADLVLFNAASASQDGPSPLEDAAETTCDAVKSLLSKECDGADDDADQGAAADD